MFALDRLQRSDSEGLAEIIIDDDDTNITMAQVKLWTDQDLKEWLEAWGYEWDGESFINPACQEQDAER